MLLDARTLGFASVATMFVVTPGVGTAVITRTVVERGRRAGFVTAAGLLSGGLVYAVATALGLAALLITFPRILRGVQLVGAVYVGWLGVMSIRAALHNDDVRAIPRGAVGESFRNGVATSLLNPMLAVFYLTVIPQFVGPGDIVVRRTLLLAGLHLMIAGSWMVVLVTGIAHLSETLASEAVRRRISLVTGVVLLLLALRLVVR